MGVYIPNLDEKKFYEICKEHNLDFIATPAADVVPVVLCKYCRFREECAFDADDDFFCAAGKKREESE